MSKQQHVSTLQRIENAAIAIAVLATVWMLGMAWWVLFAVFLLFDLSALGYLRNPRVGAVTYNLVHNYAGPALLAIVTAVLFLRGTHAEPLALVSASWAFHVAVDRALGYGLKLDSFRVTHLGPIGRNRPGND